MLDPHIVLYALVEQGRYGNELNERNSNEIDGVMSANSDGDKVALCPLYLRRIITYLFAALSVVKHVEAR